MKEFTQNRKEMMVDAAASIQAITLGVLSRGSFESGMSLNQKTDWPKISCVNSWEDARAYLHDLGNKIASMCQERKDGP